MHTLDKKISEEAERIYAALTAAGYIAVEKHQDSFGAVQSYHQVYAGDGGCLIRLEVIRTAEQNS